MKLKRLTISFGYLKQFLITVALIYAFSNCQVKKTVLNFSGIDFVEVPQKNQTQLQVQKSCNTTIFQKDTSLKKIVSTPKLLINKRIQSVYFQTKENIALSKLQIPPAFKFNKKSVTYPPVFIVFKNLKIATSVV